MPNLIAFTAKLCPEPRSTIIDDELELSLNHIDVNDAWMEFDTAYTLIAHTVIYLGLEGRLQEFRVDDVRMEGIRENLEEVLSQRLQQWWEYNGEGVWRRKERKHEEVNDLRNGKAWLNTLVSNDPGGEIFNVA